MNNNYNLFVVFSVFNRFKTKLNVSYQVHNFCNVYEMLRYGIYLLTLSQRRQIFCNFLKSQIIFPFTPHPFFDDFLCLRKKQVFPTSSFIWRCLFYYSFSTLSVSVLSGCHINRIDRKDTKQKYIQARYWGTTNNDKVQRILCLNYWRFKIRLSNQNMYVFFCNCQSFSFKLLRNIVDICKPTRPIKRKYLCL